MAGLITTTYEEPEKKAGVQNPATVSAVQTMPAANPTNAPTAQPLSTGVAAPANNAVAIKYLDPQGNYVQGYSINGKTFKDAAGTQRIDEGSIVPNAAGTQAWILQNGVGVPVANYQPGPSAAITNAYNRSVQAANQRLEANIAMIEANRPKINDAYNQLARQNYQGYMQSQEALANQLASQGLYNSGYSDTAKIAQNVGYRSAQSETERARLQALADLETEISVARLNGSANLAELEAEYAILQNEQANYEREFAYNAAQQLLDRQYQQNRDAVADNRYDTEWTYQQQRDQEADERYRSEKATEDAWRRAEYGDFSGLEAIGIDPTIYQKAYDKEQQRADEEWAMYVEEHKAKMAQYVSAEDQRLYDNAVEQAKHGNFQPLQDLGIDTTSWEDEYARIKELEGLEVQAAYQDLALGEQQIELNKKAIAEKEAAAEKEVSTETQLKAEAEADALTKMYLNSGKSRNELLAYLSTNTAKNYYVKQFGQSGYDYLLSLASAMYDSYAAPEAFDKTGFINSWKDNIFSTVEVDDGTGRKTKERVADSKQQRAAWEELQYALASGQITETEFYQILSSLGISRTISDMWYNPTKPINN